MPEFLELLPPDEALSRLLDALHPTVLSEEIATASALGRVTVAPLTAAYPLPSF